MRSLLLQGGTVVDGTGAPPRRADVLCRDARIVAVGDVAAADLPAETQRIDCDGLTITPGFIDTHSHSDVRLFAEPTLPMKLAQGTTLEVLGQDGISVAPLRPAAREQAQRQLAGLLGDPRLAQWRWETVADYLDALTQLKPAPNVSYLVPHGTLRTYVMGPEARPPTADELARMETALAQALEQGALGLSTGLIYPPCCYAERAELIALAKVAHRYGGPLVVHMRSESDYILDGIDEMVDVGAQSGCAIHISHWKIAGSENFARASDIIARVEAAQAAGVRVTCDQYPYAAGSTLLGAVLPPWVHDGGPQAALARLASPETCVRIKADMTAPWPQPWDNFWRWTGPQGIVVSDVPSGSRPEIIGRSLAEAAQAASQDPLDYTLALLKDEQLGVGMITHSQSEQVVEALFVRPYVNVCSDGLLGGRPHPRAYGCFARILARYVRERRLVSLEEAVRKMTSQAARAMNLSGRGVVAADCAADLVVFDATTITDRATFAEPTRLAEGVAHVIVNGRPAAERPGQVVRREHS